MSRDTRYRSLSIHSLAAPSRRRGSRLAVEPLERRAMLTVLTVDIADPHANDPGDNLYAQIAEAVDAAVPGDLIKVHTGSYNPFVVATDNLTIRPATPADDVIVDGDLNPGDENCVEVNANHVTIRGLTAENASDAGYVGFGFGFSVTGDNNTLSANSAAHNRRAGFFVTQGHGNSLYYNTGRHNDYDGFWLEQTSDNMLAGNIATDNGSRGFYVFQNTSDMLIGNAASGNSSGGYYASGDKNTLAAR